MQGEIDFGNFTRHQNATSVITGYAQTLSENTELSESNKQRAAVIVSNSMKIKKLIEDLNLISSMEYDMQPSKRQPIKICPLIRRVTAEILNNGLPDIFSIELNLKSENATIMGDENLLERAVFNIMNNAVTHNKNGCTIIINEFEKTAASLLKSAIMVQAFNIALLKISRPYQKQHMA